MLRALTSGLSGLKSHQTKMDVIGNNIANVNTAGFKASRVSFKDTFYQTLTGSTDANDVSGGRNPNQIGYGSNVATIDVLHTRGNYSPTGRVMDAFISGDGYFIARDGNGKERYTRTGIFNFDGDGNLVDGNQQFICGYPLDRYKADVAGVSSSINSDPTGVATDRSIRFGATAGSFFNGYRIKYVAGDAGAPVSAEADNETKVITITAPENANLSGAQVQQALRQMKSADADKDFPAYVKGALDEITADANFPAVAIGVKGTSSYSGVATGGTNAHKTGDVIFDVTPAIPASMNFGGASIDFGQANGGLLNGYKIVIEQAAAGVTVAAPYATLDGGNKVIKVMVQKTTPPAPCTITDAQLQFALQNMNPSTGEMPAGLNASLIKVGDPANPKTITVPEAGLTSTKISGGVDQIVTTRLDKENGVQQIKVPGQMIDTDGNGVYDVETGGVMNLVGIQIGSDGIISAEAPNGTIIQVGQILLASIPNPQALTLEGNSYLTAMSNTGDIVYGVPGTEGTGPLVSGGVEGSNVDLANEFADMITTQRGFQANSRIFTVGDEMLQELINLKR